MDSEAQGRGMETGAAQGCAAACQEEEGRTHHQSRASHDPRQISWVVGRDDSIHRRDEVLWNASDEKRRQ